MGAVGVWVVRAFCDVGMMAWFLVVVLEVIYYSGCRSLPLSAIFLVLLPRDVGGRCACSYGPRGRASGRRLSVHRHEHSITNNFLPP